MKIDTDKLREDLLEESRGAFYVGHFGGAMAEASEIKSASPDKLVEITRRNGVSLSDYETD